jgi:hypothetical protein
MDIKKGIPPVRPYRKIMNSIPILAKKVENLKRLLRLVKNHVIYDDELYEEIREALRK